MTVCEYFLQGRCRFGQNCRNEHSYTSDDRNIRGPLNSQQLSTVVKKVAEAVISAEKGGQWPLSSFSPLKGGANVPGWEDYSPEEIRWKMYEARANGTLNQATLEISQYYINAEKMRNILKEPTMERVNIIANLLKGRSEQFTNPNMASNPFTSLSSSSNIFGGSAQSSLQSGSQNIFGVTSSPGSQGSIFGGTATSPGNQGSIFGGSSPSGGSIFGGSSTFANQNIFGSSVQPNAFSQTSLTNSQSAAPGGSGSIFGNTAISSQNIFSKTGEANSQNISSPFMPQNNSGIFSKPSSSSIFEAKPSENLNQNQSFSFSSSQSENIFKTQKSFGKTDIFGSQPQVTKSAFGSVAQQNAFGGSQQILNEFDTSVYSKLEDLSEEEVKSFTSPTFAFGKIPLKPPPQKFCK